ncbi:uncharacterized protein EI97DRAFT_452937 [Westerdykella ornata]|uniref:TATA element modulatory factor 1 TATA binding domain-containing protein n=1 Tax=Westerdykella ornata TaxID=318751 RepID=A0A6A6J894_WESOR|nr:uncharacterized protein EI97DRAFT_452937 [Westerdykella ornata]KAF2272585.1 hypothetical protein EI97DRAFT_452937 [Westerdykella ornata]
MSGQQGSRWGSLLSGAVAGIESRLDTILADDSQASAKSRAAEAAAKQEAAKQEAAEKKNLQIDQGVSRTSSTRSRPGSSLQDRLARAVSQRSESPRASTDSTSRPESPAVRSTVATADPGRASIDSKQSEGTSVAKDEASNAEDDKKPEAIARASMDSTPVSTSPAPAVTEQPASIPLPAMSIPSIVTPETASPRPSMDSNPSRSSIDASTLAESEPVLSRSPGDVEAELAALQKTHEEKLREHREELHAHLERIDSLQAKLAYLTEQMAASAKAAAADSDATPVDKKLAEKDAQIAALMEEGQKLSKKEMNHLTTIRKMHAKAKETDKQVEAIKQRLAKAEKIATEQTERARRAEAAERAAQEKLKIVGKIEKDIELIKAEREEAGLTIMELRRQLSDALSKADEAEKRVQAGALEAEKRVTASLKEDIENLRIEKKLAEDRGKRELQEAKDEATRQREKANNLETKLELIRSRSEEVSSSATGDSQAKLLRQIETLQTQYALASENWQGIEGTLTSRVAALEKERDETAKRESDIRRKAREVNSKARKLEDELERINERARALEQDLLEQRASSEKLQARLSQAELAAEEARADLEREKKVMEADFQQKLEEEKVKWRSEIQSQYAPSESNYLRAASASTINRRNSPDPLGLGRRGMVRSPSTADVPLSPMDRMLAEDRRPSTARSRPSPNLRSPDILRSPEISPPQRQDSIPTNLNGFNGSNTPSIHAFDHDEAFEMGTSSPQRTINDMISVSTAGAGPSVQLVERMSATIRRLESERATNKEELARLVAQRDEARESVVALMREIEEKRGLEEKVARLERELAEMGERYETTLEMLGEKSERVEELEGDVADLKKIYRDLVETMK